MLIIELKITVCLYSLLNLPTELLSAVLHKRPYHASLPLPFPISFLSTTELSPFFFSRIIQSNKHSFPYVPHTIYVHLKWFRSYISGRQLFTCINSVCSGTQYIYHGVPHASIFGPLLSLYT